MFMLDPGVAREKQDLDVHGQPEVNCRGYMYALNSLVVEKYWEIRY
jgi:hypothetical protein